MAAGLSTPLGVLVSYPFIRDLGASMPGAFLGMSAGALVYVGATHLLPQAEVDRKRFSLIALAAGFVVATVILFANR